jgi:hypothetical protein
VERKIDRIRGFWDKVAPDGPPKPGPRNISGADVAKDLVDTTTILRGLSGHRDSESCYAASTLRSMRLAARCSG